jgi:phosphoglycerate dehydrogenase-like enzyme
MIYWAQTKMDPKLLERLERNIPEEIVFKSWDSGVGEEAARAEILVTVGPALGRLDIAEFQKFKSLKWLHILTSGVDALPFELLSEKSVLVTNSRGIHRTQISEQIMGMMICFSRGLHYNFRNKLEAKWENQYPYDELYGKTLCILGAGSIGKELARKAKAFDMKVIGIKNNPAEKPEYFDDVAGMDQLHEILRVSDYVVSLLPLTPSTHRLIGANEFAAMKPSAIFLNYSRGNVVDEQALILALKNGEIRGAGLDVFQTEPLPPDSELWKMENVLISPHSSGGVLNLQEKWIDLFEKLYFAYRNGGEMFNVVDLQLRY